MGLIQGITGAPWCVLAQKCVLPGNLIGMFSMSWLAFSRLVEVDPSGGGMGWLLVLH